MNPDANGKSVAAAATGDWNGELQLAPEPTHEDHLLQAPV